ncbi:hypothetical protein [Actinophytocola sp.]|uniref:hypothetical protein n=1 Tax=Actinophytocola sp. TaxID=1872138 RepID=UPI002D6119DF|nr:hypothetical protein [Actinophytocola sp.]HYQ69089.1 hypothetical protein [Actinophytocola sp.]
MTIAPPSADVRTWPPERIECGIVAALRRREFSTAGSLLALLSDRDRERAHAIEGAVTIGTTFAQRARELVDVHTFGIEFDGPIRDPRRDCSQPGALCSLWALTQVAAVWVSTAGDVAQAASWLSNRGVPVARDDTPRVGLVSSWTDRSRVLVTDRQLPALRVLTRRAVAFDCWEQSLQDLEFAALGLGTR